VTAALARASFDGPRGTIGFSNGMHYATFDMFVASVAQEGRAFQILMRVPTVAPVLTCTQE
jgi:hypothetical protein